MESTIEIILIICVASLTAIFVTVGVWVILILREVRKTAKKISSIGDDVEETSHFVKQKIKDGFSMMALLATLSTLWSKKEKLADFLPEIKDKLAEGSPASPRQSRGRARPNAEGKKDKKKENPPTHKASAKQGKKKRRFFFKKKK